MRSVRESVPPGASRLARPVALAGLGLVGLTNLQETMPLVWVMLIISAIGAAATFGALVWTLWKYRDPRSRGRRYG